MRPSWILSEEERARRVQGRAGKAAPLAGAGADLGEVARWGEAARASLLEGGALQERDLAALALGTCPPAIALLLNKRTEAACLLLPQFSCLPAATQEGLLSINLPLVARLRQAACLASNFHIHSLLTFVTSQQLPEALRDMEYRAVWRGEEEALTTLEEVAGCLEVEDHLQLLLLVLLLLFCPDGLGPEERPVVERVQLKYVLLLQVLPYQQLPRKY